jgi:hypothetical protein
MAYKKGLDDMETTVVRSGKLRGFNYEIRSYVRGRSLSGPILGYLVRVQEADGSWPRSGRRAKTLQRALTMLDQETAWLWRYENKFQQTPEGKAWLEKQNPLAMNNPEKIAIGVGLVAGLGAVLYYATRPAAAAATPPAAPPAASPPATLPAGTVYVTADSRAVNQIAPVNYGSALVINPPAGATNLTASAQGTTTHAPGVSPIAILAPAPFTPPGGGYAFIAQARGVATVTASYQDSSGVAQIATVTVTVS